MFLPYSLPGTETLRDRLVYCWVWRRKSREDIDIQPFMAEAGSHVLAARRLTDHLQDYFTQEQVRHGVG